MRRIKAFLLGMIEFRSDCTWADPARSDDIPGDYTELDFAYDSGREMAHRLTFRRFD